MFFVFEIIASELVPLNCLYPADNVCHILSFYYEKVLGICVSLRETFSNATTLTVINKYWKGAVIHIVAVFQPICHVVCLRVL